ncbi:MAG: guanylate kinase, partial [Clostridia bacterium]|nr:guanylate kinase [Clostridia bacterium]
MNKGKIFVISGPSGSGKDTLMAEIFKKRPDIKFSISSITRPMRVGEVEGQKYNFISREKFEEMLEKDMFLEHNEFVGNYYGTPKQPVLDAADNGFNILIEVDVNGADQIRAKLPQALSIF